MQERMNESIPRENCDKAPRILRKAIMGGLVAELNRILTSQGMNVQRLVSEKNEDFATMRDQLVTEAETYLKSRVASMKEQGIGRMHLDEAHNPLVAMTRQTAQKFEGIWLSIEEYLKHKGNKRKLDEIWDKKLKTARSH